MPGNGTRYAVLVKTDDSDVRYRNYLRFDTEGEAQEYAIRLYHRWSAVTEWRIVPSEEERGRNP